MGGMLKVESTLPLDRSGSLFFVRAVEKYRIKRLERISN